MSARLQVIFLMSVCCPQRSGITLNEEGWLAGMTKNFRKFFQYAGQAMDFMAQNGISPRPSNYRVWFEYSAQSTPALNMAVERLQKENRPVDENASVGLHNEFFNQGSVINDAVLDAGDQLSEKLSSALELIKTAGAGTKVYGESLDSISTDLGTRKADELTGASLQSVVDTLVTATKKMSEHSRKLEGQLHENSIEVEQLKHNLELTKQEALTDQLTKLGNRKHFDIELASAAALAEETNEPLCLIMVDIDHFKVFNDTWGHQTGDQVLRLVSACLRNDVRESDVTARYGGEEFGLILPDAFIEEAEAVAEKIRQTVQSKKVMKRSTGQDLGTITISLGVARYRTGEDITSMIERADQCLYAAKEAGRNCVITELAMEDIKKTG